MRTWVFKALCAIKIDQTYSNLYLKHHLQEVEEKNRSLATRIVYGTIQNEMYCQYIWKQVATRKVNKKMQVLLNMSVYQMLFLDKVPTYAIINDAVNIAKRYASSQAGFVNAVLRNIDVSKIVLPEDPMERLSIQSSIPTWLLQMWKAQYGQETMEQCATYSNAILPTYVRVNPLRSSMVQMYSHEDFEYVQDRIFIYKGNDLANHPLYQAGCISAQDIGSYQISQWMKPQKNDTILDCCSAPGTKAMAMAEQIEDQGHIDCIDVYEHRVQLIQSDAKRLGLSCIYAQCNDATKLDGLGYYDRVLCDVPCSGYGIFARKPDIKMHMQPTDMDTLIPLQKEILESASKHVIQGGILVYSTCTINKKENDKQIETFLKNHADFVCEDTQTIFPSATTDGFYMARLKRMV